MFGWEDTRCTFLKDYTVCRAVHAEFCALGMNVQALEACANPDHYKLFQKIYLEKVQRLLLRFLSYELVRGNKARTGE